MAYSRANDILTSYDKLVPPNRQDEDFLTKADENRLGEMKDKYINKVKQLAGVYNHFPSRVDRFIPEDLKRYGEMYFSTPEEEDIDLEVKIQNNFTNRRIEEQKQQLQQQQEANKIKMIQEAYQTGLRLPESGVNVFSPEGQAYLNSQAVEKGVSYQELVANSKKAFDQAEIKKQNDKLAEMISKKASLVVKAINQGKDLEEVLFDEMDNLKRNLNMMFADLEPKLRHHIELRAEEEFKRNVITTLQGKFRERKKFREEEEERERIEFETPIDASDIEGGTSSLFSGVLETDEFKKVLKKVNNKPIIFEFKRKELILNPQRIKVSKRGNTILEAIPAEGGNRSYYSVNRLGKITKKYGSRAQASQII